VKRTVVVVTAGLSEPSSTRLLADRLAAATERRLRAAGAEVRVEVVELRPLAHALADHLLTGFPAGALRDAVELVQRADGVIAVTPVFSASYSGLFKSFFDVLEEDVLAGVPVLAAATAGTARHSLVLEHALRPLFSYLHATVVPTAVFAATEDFGGADPAGAEGRLGERVERAATELADLVLARAARASAAGVETEGRIDDHGGLGDVVPFERLLNG
jgi:FMN reductase